eukprot:TRINITY_DN55126_c0_g1_i1.p1 TRINITY_DN55126_c0_g1~~TRINITY_DN55126_c0_g1_i1.p1  ORF type:complete len:805 (-),score=170.12 TRINITY_DN55126_c0_g1_i1:177-2492(-)
MAAAAAPVVATAQSLFQANFGPKIVKAVGARLLARDVARLALACIAGLRALRCGSRWQFQNLRLDEDVLHVPENVFRLVVSEEISQLTFSNFSVRAFRGLREVALSGLRDVRFARCALGDQGSEFIGRILAVGDVQELRLERCHLRECDLVRLARGAVPVRSPKLRRMLLHEEQCGVKLSSALAGLLREGGHGSGLNQFALRGRFELDDNLSRALAQHGSLWRLRLLNNVRLRDEQLKRFCGELMASIVSMTPLHKGNAEVCRLRCLDLSAPAGGMLTDEAGFALAEALASGYLHLADLRFVGHQVTGSSLAACLHGGGAHLRCVDFTGTNLGAGAGADPAGGALAAGVEAASSLQVFRIGGGEGYFPACAWCEDFGDDVDVDEVTSRRHISMLKWMAVSLSSFTVLDVSGVQLEDKAVFDLAAAVSSGRGSARFAIRELDLSRNLLTEKAMSPLLQIVACGHAKLRSLDLGTNSLGDEGCAAVCAALPPAGALESLWRLSLRSNAIGCIAELRRNLPKCRLGEIDLRENLFGDTEAQQLLAAAIGRRGASGPIRINLADNELSEEVAAEMAAAFGQEDKDLCGFFDDDLFIETSEPSATIATDKESSRATDMANPVVVSASRALGVEDDMAFAAAPVASSAMGDSLAPLRGREPKSLAHLWSPPSSSSSRNVASENMFGVAGITAESAADVALGEEDLLSVERGGFHTKNGSDRAWLFESSLHGIFNGVSGDDGLTSHPVANASEWQDCVDSLAWMESCLQDTQAEKGMV